MGCLNLLSLDGVKSVLGITDTTHDAALTKAMCIVTELFENYCGRGLALVTALSETYPMEKRIPARRFPIGSITSFTVDDVPEEVPKFDAVHGFFYGRWAPDSEVVVVYDGGYPQGDVPPDLAEAYARCCADYGGVPYTSAGNAGGAPLKSLSLGSGALAVQFDTGGSQDSSYDTADAPAILQPYVFVLRRYRPEDYV
jgi:hypothetical protein